MKTSIIPLGVKCNFCYPRSQGETNCTRASIDEEKKKKLSIRVSALQLHKTRLTSKTVQTPVGGLTVDVLADIVPLNTAGLVIPLSKARSYHLTTVLILVPVIRLACPPVSETGDYFE